MSEEGEGEPSIPGVDWAWGEEYRDILVQEFEDLTEEAETRAQLHVHGARRLVRDLDEEARERGRRGEVVNLAIDARRHYEDWAAVTVAALPGFPLDPGGVLPVVEAGLEDLVAWEQETREGVNIPSVEDLGTVTEFRTLLSLMVRRRGAAVYARECEDEEVARRQLRTQFVEKSRHYLRQWAASATASHALIEDPDGEGESRVPAHLRPPLVDAFKVGAFLHALGVARNRDVGDVEWAWRARDPRDVDVDGDGGRPGTTWG